MRLSYKALKKCSVETLSGTVIGHITDIIIASEGQEIIQYQVKHSKFGGSVYLISRDQVVRFEEKKMVVYDTALPNELRKGVKEGIPITPEPAVMREE